MSQALQIIQSFPTSAAPIAPYRVVAGSGGASPLVSQAAAGLPSLGIATEVGGDANSIVDVIVAGIAYLQMGAMANVGQFLTHDALGKGVVAGAAGTRIVAVLLETCTTADQICKVVISQSVL
jgi:hypothetical protein